jgi:hypothetical protein
MHMHMRDHDKCRSYTFLTKRKALSNIYSVRIALIPIVNSNDLTYERWLAYLQKNH